MSRFHGSISDQALVRFRAGDLIERGFDNDEMWDHLPTHHVMEPCWNHMNPPPSGGCRSQFSLANLMFSHIFRIRPSCHSPFTAVIA